jgi:hypothetical protein
LFLLAGGISASEPDAAGLEAARQAAQLELESGALEQALDEGANIALSASQGALESDLGRGLTEREAAQVRGVLRRALADILTPEVWIEQSSRAYARHLSAGHLEDLVAFYRSESGQAVLKIQGPLAGELSSAADALLGAQQEAFAERVDAELAEMFPDYGLAEIITEDG